MSSASRAAKISITADAAGMDRGVSEAKRKVRSLHDVMKREDAADEARERRKSRQGGIANGLGVKSLGQGMLLGAGMKITNGIEGMVVGAANEVMAVERSLLALQIAGEMSSESVAKFRAEISRASAATSAASPDLASGAVALVNFTGHADNAMASMELMGKVMKATGASSADISGIFATFDKNMHLPVDQWQGAMDVLIKQGHIGGIEMKDLASSFTAVQAASSTIFKGGSSVKSLGEVSAMAQVLNDSTHNPEDTSTRMTEMFNEFRKPATVKRLRAAGLEPFDKKTGEIKNMLGLLDELKKRNLSVEQTSDIFRDVRGSAAISFLVKNLALVHEIDNASKESNQTENDYLVQKESTIGKIDAATNKAKLSIADAFTPERLEAFAKMIGTIADGIVSVVSALEMLAKASSDMGKTPAERAAAELAARKDYAPAALDREAGEHRKKAAFLQQKNDTGDVGAASFLGSFASSPLGEAFSREFSPETDTRTADAFQGKAAGDRIGAIGQQVAALVSLNSRLDDLIGVLKNKSVTNVKVAGAPIVKAINNDPSMRKRP